MSRLFGGNRVMARTTITNDRMGVVQGNVVAQAVNFDMSSAGYGDDTPVTAPIAKPNPKLINKNGDMPVVSARANNAILRDVSAKTVVASSLPEQNSGLQSIGGGTPLNQVVLGEQNKPAPIAAVKPKSDVTISLDKIYGSSGSSTGSATKIRVDYKFGGTAVSVQNLQDQTRVFSNNSNISTSRTQIAVTRDFTKTEKFTALARISDNSTNGGPLKSTFRAAAKLETTRKLDERTKLNIAGTIFNDSGATSTTAIQADAKLTYRINSPKDKADISTSLALSSRANLNKSLGLAAVASIDAKVPFNLSSNVSGFLKLGLTGTIENNSINNLVSDGPNYGGNGKGSASGAITIGGGITF
jgi:hypothetical protein